jgi:hypothetical protein
VTIDRNNAENDIKSSLRDFLIESSIDSSKELTTQDATPVVSVP